MINKFNRIKSIIFPSKKTNIFALCIVIIGLTIGAIFLNVIGINEQNLVIDKVKLFIDNINSNNLNNIIIFKNSIGINLIYIFIIWIFGLSLIGIPINIFILFIKSFILGFSISSFIITYSYKGLALSTLYVLFGQFINILVILMVTIYSIMFSRKLFQFIFKKNTSNNISNFIKNYVIIFVISIILCLISSLSEVFLLPALIKLIIKLFI